eukprot:CAMPEP_0172693718 /NCGR_PEP_ID=MMETSP1074-20121228/26188_1 /TAXON_ID=2916 /ORGANISM="Ceratium fusus, Strain PA161109" /LENGTH=193 /DNA_ID=CAMNT_0013514135 /DNA_START=23 /DNA_END=604 /DNA_ORIENTATION=+
MALVSAIMQPCCEDILSQKLKHRVMSVGIQTASQNCPGTTLTVQSHAELEKCIANKPHAEKGQENHFATSAHCFVIMVLEIVLCVGHPLDHAMLIAEVMVCIGCRAVAVNLFKGCLFDCSPDNAVDAQKPQDVKQFCSKGEHQGHDGNDAVHGGAMQSPHVCFILPDSSDDHESDLQIHLEGKLEKHDEHNTE